MRFTGLGRMGRDEVKRWRQGAGGTRRHWRACNMWEGSWRDMLVEGAEGSVSAFGCPMVLVYNELGLRGCRVLSS